MEQCRFGRRVGQCGVTDTKPGKTGRVDDAARTLNLHNAGSMFYARHGGSQVIHNVLVEGFDWPYSSRGKIGAI